MASSLQSKYEKKEGVQCRDTKLVPYLKDMPYRERLQSLNWYSMEYGRKRGDMIQAFKILYRIDPRKFFIQAIYKGTRSHNMELFKPHLNQR